jgi:hypothetical protein
MVSSARLSWYVGRRRVGHGQRVSLRDLPPGSATVTLVATNQDGKIGSAHVRIRLVAQMPLLRVLTRPKRIGRTATRLRLRVATAVPATLTISGQSLRRTSVVVSAHARMITVTVERGRRPVLLTLTARNGRATQVLRLLVVR